MSFLQQMSTLQVDDLIQGLNDWRNIQDIVRLTFRAVNDVVKSQARTIATLESKVDVLECTLADTASRSEVEAALAQKASISDVNHTLAEISITIERSATTVSARRNKTKQDAFI